MKPKLLLATSNPGKVVEFQEALPGVELLGTKDFNLGEFPPEIGTSYDENSLIKAGFAAVGSGLPSLADDSGIEIDAMDGAPGIHSARFGGDITDLERVALVLSKLRGTPPEKRGATFMCSLVLALPDGTLRVFRGSCRGRVLEGPRGRHGFGYDPIFWSDELGKTFAEATREEKQRVGHRGRAVRALNEWLETPEARELLGA